MLSRVSSDPLTLNVPDDLACFPSRTLTSTNVPLASNRIANASLLARLADHRPVNADGWTTAIFVGAGELRGVTAGVAGLFALDVGDATPAVVRGLATAATFPPDAGFDEFAGEIAGDSTDPSRTAESGAVVEDSVVDCVRADSISHRDEDSLAIRASRLISSRSNSPVTPSFRICPSSSVRLRARLNPNLALVCSLLASSKDSSFAASTFCLSETAPKATSICNVCSSSESVTETGNSQGSSDFVVVTVRASAVFDSKFASRTN